MILQNSILKTKQMTMRWSKYVTLFAVEKCVHLRKSRKIRTWHNMAM